MNTLDDILTITGEFEILLPGQSVNAIGKLERKERIVLSVLVRKELCPRVLPSAEFRVCGNVGRTDVTLLDCIEIDNQIQNDNSDYCAFLIVPSQIIVGKCYSRDILVSEINALIPDLNYMGLEQPGDLPFTGAHVHPINQRPRKIEASDSDGIISISRKCSKLIHQDRVEFKFSPFLSYSFNQPHELMEAREKLLAARNLLTFFADHYLATTYFRFTDASDLEASCRRRPVLS